MRSEPALLRSSGTGADHVSERLQIGHAAKPPGLPPSQVVLHPPVERLAEQQPGLVHRPRQHGHAAELVVRVLRPVAAAHRHHEAHDFTPPFETGGAYGVRNPVRDERVGRDQHVSAGHQGRMQSLRPLGEEQGQGFEILPPQRRETRQGRASVAVEGWRLTPHATLAGTQFLLLRRRVLDEAVGRIRHARVQAARLASLQPRDAIAPVERRSLVRADGGHRAVKRYRPRDVRSKVAPTLLLRYDCTEDRRTCAPSDFRTAESISATGGLPSCVRK